MPAYLIAIRESVNDQSELDTYARQGTRALKGFDWKAPILYGRNKTLEGPTADAIAVLEFPTFEEAEAYYNSDAYRQAAIHRRLGGNFRIILAEGFVPPPPKA